MKRFTLLTLLAVFCSSFALAGEGSGDTGDKNPQPTDTLSAAKTALNQKNKDNLTAELVKIWENQFQNKTREEIFTAIESDSDTDLKTLLADIKQWANTITDSSQEELLNSALMQTFIENLPAEAQPEPETKPTMSFSIKNKVEETN